jgi:hypothetical protein
MKNIIIDNNRMDKTKNKQLVRLGDDKYVRPKKTYSDNVGKDEILRALEDYIEDDIENIKLGTSVRYFAGKKFRFGGNLINISGLPKYVVLSNGQKSWSVQMKNTKFFKKLSLKDLKQDYEDALNFKTLENKNLHRKLDKYEESYRKIKKENIKLKEQIKKLEKHTKKSSKKHK